MTIFRGWPDQSGFYFAHTPWSARSGPSVVRIVVEREGETSHFEVTWLGSDCVSYTRNGDTFEKSFTSLYGPIPVPEFER